MCSRPARRFQDILESSSPRTVYMIYADAYDVHRKPPHTQLNQDHEMKPSADFQNTAPTARMRKCQSSARTTAQPADPNCRRPGACHCPSFSRKIVTIRFQRYQLPAWAQTLQPNPLPTTTNAAAVASEGLQTPTLAPKHPQVTPPAGNHDGGAAVAPPAPPTRAEEEEAAKLSAMRSVASRADPEISAVGSTALQQPGAVDESEEGGNVVAVVVRQRDAEGGYAGCSNASGVSAGHKTGSGIEGASANIALSAVGGVGQGVVGGAVGRGFGVRAGDQAGRVAAAGAAVPQGRWGQRVLQEVSGTGRAEYHVLLFCWASFFQFKSHTPM